MSETRHKFKVDNQELLYEQEELAKKRWLVLANAILRDNIENSVDELKKLENASETDESIFFDKYDQQINKEKDMKIIRIIGERYAQEEFMHRVH